MVSPAQLNKAFAIKCKTENSVVCAHAPIVPIVVEEKEQGHRECFQDDVKISGDSEVVWTHGKHYIEEKYEPGSCFE